MKGRDPVGLAMAAGVGVATTLSPAAATIAVLGSVFAWVALASPSVAFMGFLLVRSSLDVFTTTGFSLGGAQLNLAGLSGLLMIGFGALVFSVDTDSRRTFGVGGPLGKGWLILIGVSAFGGLVAHGTAGTMGVMLAAKETIRLASLYAVFFLAFALYGRHPERFTRLLFLSLLVPAAVALVQLITGTSQHYAGDLMRIHGTFVHPNAFGRYLALFVILSTAILLARHSIVRRPWALFLVGAALFALIVFSFSRSSLIVCVLGIAILVAQGRRRSIPFVIAACVVLATILGGRIADRFSDLGTLRPEVVQILKEGRLSSMPVADPGEGNSFEWRVLNWLALIQTGREAPWFGYGTRTAYLVNPIRTRDDSGQMIGYAAHSEFVRAFVENGLIGLILVVLATGLVVRGIVIARRSVDRTHIAKPIGDALLAMTFGMIAIGLLAGEIFSATAALFAFMSLAGVLYRVAGEGATGFGSEACPESGTVPSTT